MLYLAEPRSPICSAKYRPREHWIPRQKAREAVVMGNVLALPGVLEPSREIELPEEVRSQAEQDYFFELALHIGHIVDRTVIRRPDRRINLFLWREQCDREGALRRIADNAEIHLSGRVDERHDLELPITKDPFDVFVALEEQLHPILQAERDHLPDRVILP
jgi:hypothetical protein